MSGFSEFDSDEWECSQSTCGQNVNRALTVGIVAAALGAAMGSGSAALGAFLLTKLGVGGYTAITAIATEGAVGGAVVNGGCGLVAGFCASKEQVLDTVVETSPKSFLVHAAGTVASVVTGQPILEAVGATVIGLGPSAAAGAAGAGAVLIPLCAGAYVVKKCMAHNSEKPNGHPTDLSPLLRSQQPQPQPQPKRVPYSIPQGTYVSPFHETQLSAANLAARRELGLGPSHRT